MNFRPPFSPEQASVLAPGIDNLYLYLIAISLFFCSVIFLVVLIFAVKYRRRSENEWPRYVKPKHAVLMEITWSVIPLMIAMSIFVWSGVLFFKQFRPPQDAHEIFVVGKQWMWKIQHPEGRREINQLHVPVGRPIKLRMTSEDVIHSFFIPAFRTKMDVLPGRYTVQWFEATKPGTYHLFCAEYCGTDHSNMIGSVVVMPEDEYETWLATGDTDAMPVAMSGEQLFKKLRCDTCHNPASGALGPEIPFMKEVKLADGRTVMADENYIRESILKPNAKVVAGFAPLMPSFEGQVTEEQILQIIAYIKSLNQDPEVSAETPVPDRIPAVV